MMRLCLASLALLAACGSQAFGDAPSGAVERESAGLAGAARAGARPPERVWSVTLSPAPGDFSLIEIGFHGARRRAISSRSLQLAVHGPFGDHYLAAAAWRSRATGTAGALVLVVNRPSPLIDPVGVHLRISARRALGRAFVWRITDPLSRPTGGLTPALCNLPQGGASSGAAGLHALGSHGPALAGFSTASAVAQAYDLVCGLPYASSFRVVVGGGCPSGSGAAPVAALCCPPNAICATAPSPPASPSPSPAPPASPPPGCAPCNPPPGYACPLVPAPNVCVAPVSGGARRAAAGAH